MQIDEMLFGITPEEAELVDTLICKHIDDEECLRHTSGEAHPVLPIDSYLEQCLTDSGRLCFRANVAANAICAFLMSDSVDGLRAEFESLARYGDIIQTAACKTLITETMNMYGLARLSLAYEETARHIDREFADKRLDEILREGKLGDLQLSEVLLEFLKGLEEE